MGLCPDCSAEGETITYVGASRSDIVEGIEAENSPTERPVESETKLVECDLCGSEYTSHETHE